MSKQWLFFVCYLFLITADLRADLLTSADIQPMMSELFKQHISKKQMTPELLKQGYANYIQQFDPEKIYLLQSEVTPWIQMDSATLEKHLQEYKDSDYGAFTELNGVIQSAIHRAQKIRNQFFQDPKSLFTETPSYSPTPLSFAQTVPDLKERIHQNLLAFIAQQAKKFGQTAVTNNPNAVLRNYERSAHSLEDRYLFVFNGRAIPTKERDNIFAINILRALAKSLDSHTAFLDPEEATQIRLRLDKGFQGVGLLFEEGLKGVIVSKIEPGSPASKNGAIQLNDRLIAIEGKSTQDLTYQEVIAELLQNNNPEIQLTFEREKGSASKTTTYTVTLEKASMVSTDKRVDVSYVPFGNGIIGKITLYSFYEGEDGISSEGDIRDAIRHLQEVGNLKGLVLDLRENGGGYLSQAVKVAGLFITNGVVVISKYSSGESHEFRDLDGKVTFDGPLVVLVSRRTASAAEIVSQALQDYGVALIVGDDRTYGKGSIQSQTVTGAPGSSYFKVTVGKYYTVSGKSPQGEGVHSDIIVPGVYMKNNIQGDAPMDAPAQFDNVEPAFNDSLKDVRPEVKPWFIKYYTPTLQHRVDLWREMLPVLTKNSSYRLQHNKNYQLFLTGEVPREPGSSDEEDEELGIRKGSKNYGLEDLQMAEAVRIVEDMIRMESLHPVESVGSRIITELPTEQSAN